MVAISEAYKLKSNMRCAKYMLLLISFMFALTGIFAFYVKSGIYAIFGDFHQFIDYSFLSPQTLVIIIASFLIIVASLGAFGALRESETLIKLYGVCLLTIFVFQVTVAIIGLELRETIHEMLQRNMNASMYQYEHCERVQIGVDFLQSHLQCCGVNSPSDWKAIRGGNNTDYLPSSCGGTVRWGPAERQISAFKYVDGCLNRLEYIIRCNTMEIVYVASADALLMLLGVVSAFVLADNIRKCKSYREYLQTLGSPYSMATTTIQLSSARYHQLKS